MNYEEAEAALRATERTLNVLDSFASTLARLLRGRLRKVNNATALRALKAELANFDSRTGNIIWLLLALHYHRLAAK